MAKNITIVGFGTMGKAIANNLSKNQSIKIWAIDRAHRSFPENSDFIILAVKPQNLKEIAEQIKNQVKKDSVVISILAGVKIKTLEQVLGSKKIVRVMPNLGLSIGAGIAVWKGSLGLSANEQKNTKKILDLICENIEVKDEEMIDSATAISGSGPAYFFLLANAMLEGARSLKLDEETSQKLVARTFKAAALLGDNKNYMDMIAKIASPGGTTAAAINSFNEAHFDQIVRNAIEAAKNRAKELSKGK